MNKIRPNLYLGSWRGIDSSEEDWKVAGITAVLNVARDHSQITHWSNVQFTKIGLGDGPDNPPFMIYLAVKTLKHLLACDQIVYCHCISGVSRSPHIAALALAELEGRSYQEAYDEIRRIRPEVLERSRLDLGTA